MKIIYLTFSSNIDLYSHGVHIDLMKKIRDEHHEVYVVCPLERRKKQNTYLEETNGFHILRVWTLNLKKSNFIEKGIGTLLVEYQFKNAIKKHLSNIRFDLVLYSTPPITFPGVISYLKKSNNNIVSYLLLKDIFPQNAVDLGMMSLRSPIYHHFRNKEIKLYKISDYIGCMSPANIEYLIKHNTFIDPVRVEEAPNSLIPQAFNQCDKNEVRKRYNLPVDQTIFIYGGNLGKPQGIDFLIHCLSKVCEIGDAFFLVIGSGAEFVKLEKWFKETNPQNSRLLRGLPVDEYNSLVQACDVGMIFLDYRFTIPNFPARLLSYLQFHMPVLAVTDTNTDVGKIASDNGFGLWCPSNDVSLFESRIFDFLKCDRKKMGEKGYRYFLDHYTVTTTYNTIFKHFDF